MSQGRLARRISLASIVAAAVLTANASPAGAAVTIGQLAPGTASSACRGTFDRVQVTVTSGNTYVVPGTGTITSWSHNARAGPGQVLTMKVYRPHGPHVGAGPIEVVGHDGPRGLAPGLINTFPASIPVKLGDVLGLHTPGPANTACLFPAGPGDSHRFRAGDLADGVVAPGPAEIATGSRVNVSAVFEPLNSFTLLGKVVLNKKKGTATLTVNVPNPGELTGSGKGVKVASAAAISKTVSPGNVKLTIKAKGKKKRKLNETGKVKVKPKITYTPAGGSPSTQSKKLKLKKKLR
jgi:hypothetical protein